MRCSLKKPALYIAIVFYIFQAYGINISRGSDTIRTREDLSNIIPSTKIPQTILTVRNSTIHQKVPEVLSSEPVKNYGYTSSGVPLTLTSFITQDNVQLAPATDGEKDRLKKAQVLSTESVPQLITSLQIEQEKPEDDLDPLADNLFLSFEEWRISNLKKRDQESNNKHPERHNSEGKWRHFDNVQQSLESMGEEEEVDMEMFGTSSPNTIPNNSPNEQVFDSDLAQIGKLYKDRFNYASVDCAATIMKTSRDIKRATNILKESKDSYMLMECQAPDHFIIIELCEDIYVHTVVIANFEFFSSTFKDIRISESNRYPVSPDGWRVLGEFQAQNIRDLQLFHIKNSNKHWARYLKIEFLTYRGHEFYCPVSLVRVHGITLIEEYQIAVEQKKQKQIEDSPALAGEIHTESKGIENQQEQYQDKLNSEDENNGIVKQTALSEGNYSSSPPMIQVSKCQPDSDQNHTTLVPSFLCNQNTKKASLNSQQKNNDKATFSKISTSTKLSTSARYNGSHTMTTCAGSPISAELDYQSKSKRLQPPGPSLCSTTNSWDNMFLPLYLNESCCWDQYLGISLSNNETKPDIDQANTMNRNFTSRASSSISSNKSLLEKPSSAKVTWSAEPTIQESIYKTMAKRLSLLEDSANLSLQYMEQQSRSLREAINMIEKKQNSKIELFLEQFNRSVLTELNNYKLQYETIIHQIRAEIANVQTSNEQDVLLLNIRLNSLAGGLAFQQRLSILLSFVLLAILMFIILTRGATLDHVNIHSATITKAANNVKKISPHKNLAGIGISRWKFRAKASSSSDKNLPDDQHSYQPNNDGQLPTEHYLAFDDSSNSEYNHFEDSVDYNSSFDQYAQVQGGDLDEKVEHNTFYYNNFNENDITVAQKVSENGSNNSDLVIVDCDEDGLPLPMPSPSRRSWSPVMANKGPVSKNWTPPIIGGYMTPEEEEDMKFTKSNIPESTVVKGNNTHKTTTSRASKPKTKNRSVHGNKLKSKGKFKTCQ